MINNACVHVAYADDHILVRRSILSYLQNLGGICVDIEADNGSDLLKQLSAVNSLPDVIMLDVNMPQMDGFETLCRLKEKWPKIKVLVLTAFETDWHLIKMISIGINGYLVKNCAPQTIKHAIESINEYGFYYAGAEEERLYNKIRNGEVKLPHITDKEMEYLRFCPTELNYVQIATRMNTTVKAIEGYMTRLCDKLHLKGRLGLALFAVHFGYAKMDAKELSKTVIGIRK